MCKLFVSFFFKYIPRFPERISKVPSLFPERISFGHLRNSTRNYKSNKVTCPTASVLPGDFAQEPRLRVKDIDHYTK